MEKGRVELKYKVPIELYDSILYELEPYVDMDEHCNERSYFINNLYLDTHTLKSANECFTSKNNRKKLRLRQYNNNPNKTFLELKIKSRGLIKKERELVNFDKDILLTENNKPNFLIKNSQINNFILENRLTIGTRVCYNRIAFIDKESALRITFDSNIRTVTKQIYNKHNNFIIPKDIFLTDRSYIDLLKDEYILMEIKTSSFIPFYFLNILTKYKLHNIGFSKYGKAIKELNKELI